MRRSFHLIAFTALFTLSSFAQQSSLQTRADELAAASKFDEAAKVYTQLTAAEPGNGYAWMSLGDCFLSLGKSDEAVAAYDKAVSLRFRPVLGNVNKARVFANKGELDLVLPILHQLIEQGNGGRARAIVLSSTEFDKFKDDPKFQDVMKQMAPCVSPPYRQFDFWVGDWEVQDPQGHVVGKNLVTTEQEGCLLVEHWTSATGGQTGTSFNYYDVRDKKWHQLYIDNSGNAGAFPALTGELQNSKMVLLTDENSSPFSRWTWYVLSPGKVRQMAEISTDK